MPGRFFRTAAAVAAVTVALLSSPRAAPAAERSAVATIDWPLYNNDAAGDRFAAIAQIDRANVGGLHAVCTASLGAQNRFESGPIVVAGVLYVTTDAKTFAIDAATCRSLWTNVYPLSAAGLNRGAAYANGRLFRGFGDGHVIAIDAATGATLWNKSIIAAGSLEFINAAPVASQTAVFIGTAGGDSGQSTRVAALDQATGKRLWSGQGVPPVGDGSRARTWRGATRIAGGSTWTSYTLDGGRLYVPVGNPGPDFDIRLRRGSNLFTNSLVELNATDGQLERAIQFDPQDDHDWDLSAAPAVVRLPNGNKVLLSGGKDGYLRSINLATYRQLWQTAITTIQNASAPIAVTGTHFCPGTGGILWNGPAYSPRTGSTYVASSDWCKLVKLNPAPLPYVAGQSWLGTSDGYGVSDATKSGWLYAIDATTGSVRWRYHAPLPLVAGVTPTSGGLVFTADLGGNVLAFDDTTGALLKSIPTGLPVGGGVVSYTTGSKQYVAVAAGMQSNVFGTTAASSAIVILSI